MLRSQISKTLWRYLLYNFSGTFEKIDKSITSWMSKFGLLLLLSVGIVFFWFGILKFFPGLSPAQDLAIRTIDLLSFGLVPA